MEGNMWRIYEFISGNTKFLIPVYQRNYDWKIENCQKLWEDLISLEIESKRTHFFGSLVVKPGGQSEEKIVIDGQQRLTTLSLLFLAIYKWLIVNNTVETYLNADKIKEYFLIYEFFDSNKYHKIQSNPRDFESYKKLFGDEKFYDEGSNITRNFKYFYEKLNTLPITIDQFFESIQKLQCMVVNLNSPEDDAQLIFESLNSTGLDLTEADKVRNFLLMNEEPVQQNYLFENYWEEIERQTEFDMDNFMRDYLTMKEGKAPVKSDVYHAFTEYYKKRFSYEGSKREFFDEFLNYSNAYHQIVYARSMDKKINQILSRFMEIDVTVIRPFLMAIFNDYNQNIIDKDEMIDILEAVEVYIARRMIVRIPTNALNKIFAVLYRDMIKIYENERESVKRSEIIKYLLLNKKNTGRIPRDEEFLESLRQRDFYNINSKLRTYIFERLENYNHIEALSIFDGVREKDYSIEHIMPQTLNEAWRRMLGKNFKEIHDHYLHSLGNLTLTGYNSKYSNDPFKTKQFQEKGFKESHFVNLNKLPATAEAWTEKEIITRTEDLSQQALKIWAILETNYEPVKEIPEMIIFDGTQSFTNYNIYGYRILSEEYLEITTWKDMYLSIVKQLFEVNSNPIIELAKTNAAQGLARYFATESSDEFEELSSGVFIQTSMSNYMKMANIRQLFDKYNISYDSLLIDATESSKQE